MEKNFPWYRWISSRGEDLDMPFTILNFPVKFVSLFEHGHHLSKIGEGEPYYLVTNEFRKKNGHKDRFSPISERTNSFTEIKTDF